MLHVANLWLPTPDIKSGLNPLNYLHPYREDLQVYLQLCPFSLHWALLLSYLLQQGLPFLLPCFCPVQLVDHWRQALVVVALLNDRSKWVERNQEYVAIAAWNGLISDKCLWLELCLQREFYQEDFEWQLQCFVKVVWLLSQGGVSVVLFRFWIFAAKISWDGKWCNLFSYFELNLCQKFTLISVFENDFWQVCFYFFFLIIVYIFNTLQIFKIEPAAFKHSIILHWLLVWQFALHAGAQAPSMATVNHHWPVWLEPCLYYINHFSTDSLKVDTLLQTQNTS